MVRSKGSRLMVGRGKGCKIRIPSGSVSRFHCLINWVESNEGYYVVEDSGSTNGTFINGVTVTQAVSLLPGDDLQVGNITFRVQYMMKPKTLRALSNHRSNEGYPPPGVYQDPTSVMVLEQSRIALANEIEQAEPIEVSAMDSLEIALSEWEPSTEFVEIPQPPQNPKSRK